MEKCKIIAAAFRSNSDYRGAVTNNQRNERPGGKAKRASAKGKSAML